MFETTSAEALQSPSWRVKEAEGILLNLLAPAMRREGANANTIADIRVEDHLVRLLALMVLFASLLFGQTQQETMIDQQIESRGIRDSRVLAALRAVPRRDFVPPDLISEAHRDSPLPIGRGQTISQPYIVAYMSEALDVQPTHKVLEIGTGSGYQAAVLSKLARHVFSIEVIEELGELAKKRLARLGFDNVEVRIGDGYKGWPEEAPFDRIMLTAAPPSVPEALLEQLAPGGWLIAPVGPTNSVQRLVVAEKDDMGRVRMKSGLAVRFVPMVRQD